MPAGTPSWENLKERIISDLGGGMIDIELTDNNLDKNIEETLREFRATASQSTKDGYQFLSVTDNQRFYPLPSYVIDVTNIIRMGASVVSGIEGLQYGAFIYQSLQSGQPFDLVAYHMTESFIEMLNQMTAADPAYIFHSSLDGSQIGYTALAAGVETINVPDTSIGTQLDNLSRLSGPVLELLQTPKTTGDTYLLNIRFARTDAELINDMDAGVWIHRYARACAKITLGNAYRKFDGMPGPGGGISLPGADMINEGKEEQLELKQDLLDLKYGEEPLGFLMG